MISRYCTRGQLVVGHKRKSSLQSAPLPRTCASAEPCVAREGPVGVEPIQGQPRSDLFAGQASYLQ